MALLILRLEVNVFLEVLVIRGFAGFKKPYNDILVSWMFANCILSVSILSSTSK
jgi:hypothetical protein